MRRKIFNSQIIFKVALTLFVLVFEVAIAAAPGGDPPPSASASVNPYEINLQGKLTDSSGTSISNGPHNLVFKIYTASSGGSAMWTETWNASTRFSSTVTGTAPSSGGTSVTYVDDSTDSSLLVGDTLYNASSSDEVLVEAIDTTNNIITISPTSKAWTTGGTITTKIVTTSGLFSARLGSITSLNSLTFATTTYYMGITVESDSEMTPRRWIAGVPFALDADRVDGFHATSSNLAGANHIPVLDANGYLVINQRIGVGSSTPWGTLSVEQGSLNPVFVVADQGTSTPHLLVDGRGYVGVGSSSPFALFSVNAPANTHSFVIGSSTNTYLIVDKNGMIGMGLNSPQRPLHIYRSGSNTAGVLMANGDTGATSQDGFLVDYHADNGAELWNFENTDMWFGVNNDRKMTIKNSGSLGIGTSTPRSLFNIAGTRPQFTISDTSAGTDDKHWYISSQGGNLYIGTSSDALNSTSTYFSINSKGSVGLGTTTPSTTFGLVGSQYLTGGLGVGVLNTTAGTLRTSGGIQAGGSLLIDNTGGNSYIMNSLGIATDSPAVEFSVLGNGYFTAGLGIGVVNTSAGTLQTSGNATVGGTLTVSGSTSATSTFSTVITNDLAAGNDLIIAAEGTGKNLLLNPYFPNNVGIATTSPATKFSVGGAGYFTGGLGVGVLNTTAGTLQTSGNATVGGVLTINGVITSTSTFNTIIANDALTTNNLIIASEGDDNPLLLNPYFPNNVGIATTSPATKFSVGGAGYFTGGLGVGVLNTSNGTLRTTGNITTDNTLTVNGTATSTFSGAVGIGTTTPRSKFNIAGIYPQFTITDTSASVNEKHWFISPQGGNLYIGSSTDDLTATSTYLTLNSKGYLGIASTSPTTNLGVVGSGYISSNLTLGGYLKVLGTATSTFGGPLDAPVGSNFIIETPPGKNILLNPYTFDIGTGAFVAIGTSTPRSLFNIASTRPQFTISDTSAGTNDKHWYISSQGGNLYIGTSSDALNSTSTYLTINGKSGVLDIAFSQSASDVNLFTISNSSSSPVNIKFRVNAGGDIFADGSLTNPADYAEAFEVVGDKADYEPGDVIALSTDEAGKVIKAKKCEDDENCPLIIGVYSTKPGIIGTLADDVTNYNINQTNEIPVGILGRMPVKISLENGEIKSGDKLTISSQEGIAMKANKSDSVIGIALATVNEGSVEGDRVLMLISANGAYGNSSYSALDVSANDLFSLNEAGNVELKNNLDLTGNSINNVSSIRNNNSNWVIDENGLMRVKRLITDEIEMKDKTTGETYCVYMDNGELINKSGACEAE